MSLQISTYEIRLWKAFSNLNQDVATLICDTLLVIPMGVFANTFKFPGLLKSHVNIEIKKIVEGK